MSSFFLCFRMQASIEGRLNLISWAFSSLYHFYFSEDNNVFDYLKVLKNLYHDYYDSFLFCLNILVFLFILRFISELIILISSLSSGILVFHTWLYDITVLTAIKIFKALKIIFGFLYNICQKIEKLKKKEIREQNNVKLSEFTELDSRDCLSEKKKGQNDSSTSCCANRVA